ncbi:SAG family member [Eimeria mitis]|uniref:SAG family member n=1 Tax=Eimeria mitis TaxID=44415 RepID=U6JWX1_9EIME|nr:SAG family member [Eimeria mitis]CDJ28018.1 SAG family member [Eimeria mitis]
MVLESEKPDCAAAVSHWKDAVNNFTTIPPAKNAAAVKHWKDAVNNFTTIPPAKNDDTDLYKKQQNISFVALYNPSNDAAADCREESADVTKSGNENEFQAGTYAYMVLESEKPDCAAAVSHWKDAVNNFTTIPPAKDDQTTLYKTQQNISFVALYNPSNDAAADCRVVTCTRAAASEPPQVVYNRSTDGGKTGYALLCMTTPEALKESEAPFTEDQWKKIKASITGSASAVAPSLLAVAIAAVGLLAL